MVGSLVRFVGLYNYDIFILIILNNSRNSWPQKSYRRNHMEELLIGGRLVY